MSSTVDRVPLTQRSLALREELRAASRQYGSSLVRLAARSALLRWRRGFGPREALFEGLLDPALPREPWAMAVPKHRMMHLQKRFNPDGHLVLTEDKVEPGPDSGFALPCYQEACELVLRAARLFLPLRTIGWDVAATSSGPVLVEGNARWDPVSWLLMTTGSEEAHRRWRQLLDALEARDH